MAKINKINNLASYIDHTLLKPDATKQAIVTLCNEAVEHHFAAVCVPPHYVKMVKPWLDDSSVKVATVIGFPLGFNTTESKFMESKEALTNGADEIDMVMNISAFKSADYAFVSDEIKAITALSKSFKKIIKIIIETALLTDEEVVKACSICADANVDFVKTSTGFSSAGATVHHIKLMRKSLPQLIKLKASGGIKTTTFAQILIDAGAERLGCSAGLEIIGVN